MKFKIELKNNSMYSEVGQRNPLRWKTLYMKADGSFEDQSGWVKCKDFYNDTVAWFKEKSVFAIYGYQNNIKKNADGVYFLLKYINDMDSFVANMKVMNARLKHDLDCEVGVWPRDEFKDEVVILIPNELWESTYRISMVTFVIRLCNYGYKYKTWDDFWNTNAPSHTMEQAFTDDARKNALKMGFTVPKKFEKFWYFCGDKYNSEINPKATGGMIHNNGCSNWSMYMKGI